MATRNFSDSTSYAAIDARFNAIDNSMTVAALLASTTPARGTGALWQAGGYRYTEAASGATDHHLTTAGGVKLYVNPLHGGSYAFAAWGPVAGGVTDNYAKLRSAGDACRLNNIPGLILPAGSYYISQELEVDWRANIRGERSHTSNSTAGTTLVFPPNTNGIRICRAATSTSGGSADDSYIENVELYCNSNLNGTGHGWVLDARAYLNHCSAENFCEDGFHCDASAAGSKNANLWTYVRCKSRGAGRDGFYWNGADANAGYGIGLNSVQSGRFNFNDSSFLGNTHISYHSSQPGRRGYGAGSDGKGYRCILDHVGTADTIPVTGASWATYWEEFQPTTAYPLIAAGTKYYESRGGLTGSYPFYHYVSDGDNGVAAWITPYAEGASGDSSGGSYFSNSSNVIAPQLLGFDAGGSTLSVEPKAGARAFLMNQSPLSSLSTLVDSEETVISTLGQSSSGRLAAFSFTAPQSSSLVWALDFDAPAKVWRMRGSGSSSYQTYMVYDAGNASARPEGLLDFGSMGFALSDKRHTSSNAEPTSGTYKRGDVVWANSPSSGGYMGWVCTTAGVAGSGAVFKQFGLIT